MIRILQTIRLLSYYSEQQVGCAIAAAAIDSDDFSNPCGKRADYKVYVDFRIQKQPFKSDFEGTCFCMAHGVSYASLCGNLGMAAASFMFSNIMSLHEDLNGGVMLSAEFKERALARTLREEETAENKGVGKVLTITATAFGR